MADSLINAIQWIVFMCFGYTIRGKLTPLITLISGLRTITWIHLDRADHLDDRRSGRKVATSDDLNPGIFRTSQTFIKLEITNFTRPGSAFSRSDGQANLFNPIGVWMLLTVAEDELAVGTNRTAQAGQTRGQLNWKDKLDKQPSNKLTMCSLNQAAW